MRFIGSCTGDAICVVAALVYLEWQCGFVVVGHLLADPDDAVADFEAAKPNVLILAFQSVATAERYYLGLFKAAPEAAYAHPHRTILLCTKDAVQDVYIACREGVFDDYVVFWPIFFDSPRLAMAIHQATRSLSSSNQDARALQDQMSEHASDMAGLEGAIDKSTKDFETRAAAVNDSISKAESEISDGIADLEKLMLGAAINDEANAEARKELERLKQETVKNSINSISESAQSMEQWADQLKDALAPQISSARKLGELSKRKPLILTVDDDEFQHKAIKAVLGKEGFATDFVSSARQAFIYLRTEHPDLILMDYEMPNMNGVEMVRCIKSTPSLWYIPVIMLTGKRVKAVVAESLRVGATDYIGKPFDGQVLIQKIQKALNPKKAVEE